MALSTLIRRRAAIRARGGPLTGVDNAGRQASGRLITKSISIKDQGCRSDRGAGKAIELTWGGLRRVPSSELGKPRGDPTAAQKSAEGIVGQAVGKASEALQCRKAEQQIGRAGNDGQRPERVGVASRTGNS